MNIVLVGMSGAGKSTLGVLLAILMVLKNLCKSKKKLYQNCN